MDEFDVNQLITEQISIPSKCEGCGVQCELATEIGTLLLAKRVGEIVGTDFMSEEFSEFVSELSMGAPAEEVEEVITGVRKVVGDDLDMIDERITGIRNDMVANAEVCDGTFKMRASKGAVTYLVRVCTSSRVYAQNTNARGYAHLPSHIETSPANQK